jgi:hypothetical protein
MAALEWKCISFSIEATRAKQILVSRTFCASLLKTPFSNDATKTLNTYMFGGNTKITVMGVDEWVFVITIQI